MGQFFWCRPDKTYAYDLNSRVTGITDTLDANSTAIYTYYEDGRLKRATGAWGDAEWDYDGVGNRLTDKRYVSGVLTSTETYTYDPASNRLTSIADDTPATIRSLTYTADGSIDTDARPSGQLFDYDYNEASRLSSVTAAGLVAASYKYDTSAHRVWRDTPSEGVRHFVFGPGGRLVGEYDGATGSVVAEYLWLEDRLVASVDGLGAITYVQTGHLGQPLALMDASAAVTWRGETSPFGTYVYTAGSASDPDLRLPGQWLEAGSGLYQNWHRDYDPSLGRYIEADPLGIAAGQSLYGYVGQDPLNLIDPEGLRGRGLVGIGGATLITEVAVAMASALDRRTSNLGGQCSQPGDRPSFGDVIGGAIGDTLRGYVSPAGLIGLLPGPQPPMRNAAGGAPLMPGLSGAGPRSPSSGGPRGGGNGPNGRGAGDGQNNGCSGNACIGKLGDLERHDVPGDWTLLNHMPDNLGSPRANWGQNASVLRREMSKGRPIKDVSVGSNGELLNNTGFLAAERNLLSSRGWTYNPATRLWSPPG